MSDIEFKVVVTGPFGAGKTTFISHISNIPVVGTEVGTTGSEAALKPTTTVGLEYGTFSVDTDAFDIRLLLYGTPGQQRFSFMWDVVSIGADGFVVLVDAASPETWVEAEQVLCAFLDKAPTPLIVGANRGVGDPARLGELNSFLGRPYGVPVVACDVTDPRSARVLLGGLIDRIIDQPEPEPEPDPVPALTRSLWTT